MCLFSDTIFVCETCYAMVPQPRFRYQCQGSKNSGRNGHGCRYFEEQVHLVLLAPTCTSTRCYWCYVGRPLSRDANRPAIEVLRHAIRRSFHTGIDYRTWFHTSDPNPGSFYGPMQLLVSRRV